MKTVPVPPVGAGKASVIISDRISFEKKFGLLRGKNEQVLTPEQFMPRQSWTAADLAILETYPQIGLASVAGRLGRSADSVSSMAYRVGLKVGSRERQVHVKVHESKSVNAHFFQELSPQAAYVIGVVWGCGNVRTSLRKVLILDLPEEREHVLQAARSLMRSSHTPQKRPGAVRLEVCNSYLLESLIRNFGYPPRRSDRSPRFPQNVLPFLGHFARGLLDATGTHDERRFSWTGPTELMSELSQHIQTHAVLPNPPIKIKGRWMTISWELPYQVEILRNWLPDCPSLVNHPAHAVQRG
jgi:hypothetical protein